jgi:TrpR-related protein YerC/YecD
MGKVRYHELADSAKKKYLGDFYKALFSLKNKTEMKNFIKDILTLSEIVMISRRLQIAKMLVMDKTYTEIKTKLKVGNATITSVDRWLNSGFGGYKKAIRKIKDNKQLNKVPDDISGTFDDLRKKHPAHFWLINNFLDK